MRLRRQCGSAGRPLNFTVRSPQFRNALLGSLTSSFGGGATSAPTVRDRPPQPSLGAAGACG